MPDQKAKANICYVSISQLQSPELGAVGIAECLGHAVVNVQAFGHHGLQEVVADFQRKNNAIVNLVEKSLGFVEVITVHWFVILNNPGEVWI